MIQAINNLGTEDYPGEYEVDWCPEDEPSYDDLLAEFEDVEIPSAAEIFNACKPSERE